jgi:hypothetical protein
MHSYLIRLASLQDFVPIILEIWYNPKNPDGSGVRLLLETDDPIATIALECGYTDQSAFTRQFRQTLGMSPSKYRSAHGVPF